MLVPHSRSSKQPTPLIYLKTKHPWAIIDELEQLFGKLFGSDSPWNGHQCEFTSLLLLHLNTHGTLASESSFINLIKSKLVVVLLLVLVLVLVVVIVVIVGVVVVVVLVVTVVVV